MPVPPLPRVVETAVETVVETVAGMEIAAGTAQAIAEGLGIQQTAAMAADGAPGMRKEKIITPADMPKAVITAPRPVHSGD